MTAQASPRGYALLCCNRSYLCVDMYASLEVHTEDTLRAGEEEAELLSVLLQVCTNFY